MFAHMIYSTTTTDKISQNVWIQFLIGLPVDIRFLELENIENHKILLDWFYSFTQQKEITWFFWFWFDIMIALCVSTNRIKFFNFYMWTWLICTKVQTSSLGVKVTGYIIESDYMIAQY